MFRPQTGGINDNAVMKPKSERYKRASRPTPSEQSPRLGRLLGNDAATPECDECGRRRPRDMSKPCRVCGYLPDA